MANLRMLWIVDFGPRGLEDCLGLGIDLGGIVDDTEQNVLVAEHGEPTPLTRSHASSDSDLSLLSTITNDDHVYRTVRL